MNIEQQIDKAYDFRGHATITLKSGESLVGFVYNRVKDAGIPSQSFIEVFPKDRTESLRFLFSEVAAVECTGEDCAAGDSYHEYLKKKHAREQGEFDVK